MSRNYGVELAVCFLALLAIGPAVNAQNITHNWSKCFGGTSLDYGQKVAIDPNGNVFVTGCFKEEADFGGGPMASTGGKDIFLVKFDPSGNHLWSGAFGGTGDDEGLDVIVDQAGNVIITGQFSETVDFGGGSLRDEGQGDLFIAKYNASGSHLWSRRLGCRHPDHGGALALDNSGSIYVIGEYTGCERANDEQNGMTLGGLPNIVVAKYDEHGTRLYYRRIGSPYGVQTGTGIAVDNAGNMCITGRFTGSFSFGGDPLVSAGSFDTFVAKLDSEFGHVWSFGVGGSGSDTGKAIAMDSSGNVIVLGAFSDTVDFGGGPITAAGYTDIFLVKYDGDGQHRWSHGIGGSLRDEGASIALDDAGNIFATGYFGAEVDFGGGPLSSAGSADIFLAKYDQAGAHIWSRRFGDATQDEGLGVSLREDGVVIGTGIFGGVIDFGGGPYTTSGFADIYLAAFSEKVTISAHLDIKPGSCVNPLSLTPFDTPSRSKKERKGGVLTVAILGTEDFDVSEIDMSSLRLENASALRYAFTDLAAPAPTESACDCSSEGRDGFMDVTVKFQKSDVVATLGPAKSGDIVTLTLTGQLNDGTQFEASDCVRIVGGETEIHDLGVPRDVGQVLLQPATPNPFNPVTRIGYILHRESFVRLAVFDVKGRLIEELVAANQLAGEHVVEWDAKRASSGIYFARIVAGSAIDTRKLVLLK